MCIWFLALPLFNIFGIAWIQTWEGGSQGGAFMAQNKTAEDLAGVSTTVNPYWTTTAPPTTAPHTTAPTNVGATANNGSSSGFVIPPGGTGPAKKGTGGMGKPNFGCSAIVTGHVEWEFDLTSSILAGEVTKKTANGTTVKITKKKALKGQLDKAVKDTVYSFFKDQLKGNLSSGVQIDKSSGSGMAPIADKPPAPDSGKSTNLDVVVSIQVGTTYEIWRVEDGGSIEQKLMGGGAKAFNDAVKQTAVSVALKQATNIKVTSHTTINYFGPKAEGMKSPTHKYHSSGNLISSRRLMVWE